MKTVWGLSLCLAALCAEAEESKPVRVYTNEDLARVSPFRDETGVNSTPAEAPSSASTDSAARSSSARSRSAAGGDESYWRREAEKVRGRVRPLEERRDALRDKVEERRRNPKVFPYSDPQIRSAEERIRRVESQIRDIEGRFEERTRRAGVPPGWLR